VIGFTKGTFGASPIGPDMRKRKGEGFFKQKDLLKIQSFQYNQAHENRELYALRACIL
jgi:hypothetical protein